MEQNSFIHKISLWLHSYLKNHTIVSEIFLIGSTLDKQFKNINDVDIVQKLNASNKIELLNYSTLIKLLKSDFEVVFQKPLHITTFTSNEYNAFAIFIAKNKTIKII